MNHRLDRVAEIAIFKGLDVAARSIKPTGTNIKNILI